MSSKDIYQSLALTENINLTPADTNYNIDEILKKKLALKVEGRCIKEGYVKPDSVGTINYVIKFKADICIISNNQIVTCEIYNKDKSAAICYIGEPETSPVEIYLHQQHHIGNIEYANLKKEDIIKVKIARTSYEYKDKKIIANGTLVEKV
jgi:hypothetical protein